MNQQPRRQRGGYFAIVPDAPPPLVVRVTHRVAFSDVDPMGVLWHGRYAHLFEQANEELGRRCGLSYADFHAARLVAPIVQFHVDYFAPVVLAEVVTIIGRMLWSDAARMDIEYEIRKHDGTLAATGYTVQMFVGEDRSPQIAVPAILESCRKRWRSGEFGGLA
jgi:acyl-CoA thioester hydrolase